MLKSPFSTFTLLAFALGLPVSHAARADTITSIVPVAQSATLGRDGRVSMSFTVSGLNEGSDSCGIWINYGDGDSPDTRIVSRQDGQFPRTFEHTFTRTGQFAVVAKGDRVKSTTGCGGNASTTINIVAAEVPRQVDTAASCPAGWALVQGSWVRRTGAFTCAPAYPAERLECNRGLRYFESAGTIGCRPRARQ